MARKKSSTTPPAATVHQCKEDFERIHRLLHDTIVYIEVRASRILGGAEPEDAEKNLDQLIGMLAKVAALITKLLPENDGNETTTEEGSEVNLALLEAYLERRKKSST